MTAVQPQLARTALQNALADFTTPLLYDHWYVACLKNDLTDRLIERTFLNRSVVMYRTAEGTPTRSKIVAHIARFRSRKAGSRRMESVAATMGQNIIIAAR